MARDPRHPVKATRRSFAILEELEHAGTLGVTALADRVDVSKATAYNHLSTLEAMGYVTRSDGEYTLGMRFLALGRRARERVPALAAIEDELTELQAATGESVSLLAIEDEHTVCALAYGNRADRWFDIGDRFPIHETVAGCVALSRWDDDDVSALIEDVPDAAAVEESVSRARENGILFGKAEHGENFRGVATVVDADTDPTLVVEVSGDARHLTGRRLEEDVTGLLLSTVKRIEIAIEETD
ncbi:hypothetical protein GCM10009037_30160 [Halarchaeum grantii]|uniref:Transcriptional regulator, IclR family n=1 Tax=Halarchaeum grantii TaxID=1193105 RepID=A0A830F6U4_9EURY|nr:helix-turn-helix domain-containing protein [Halarchaeum grantii]GGL44736.1 hypothetical protein GCM10009037_30160 [Halarchaeum grantii]